MGFNIFKRKSRSTVITRHEASTHDSNWVRPEQTTLALPPELIFKILEMNVQDLGGNDGIHPIVTRLNYITRLKTYALVSSFFRTWAQKELLRDAWVRSPWGIKKMRKCLESYPHLGQHVEKLTIEWKGGDEFNDDGVRMDYRTTYPGLPELLACCTRLTELHLTGTEQLKMKLWSTTLSKCPTIEKLFMCHAEFYHAEEPAPFFGKKPFIEPPVPPPALRQLILHQSKINLNWPGHDNFGVIFPNLEVISFDTFVLKGAPIPLSATRFHAPELRMLNFVARKDLRLDVLTACPSLTVLGIHIESVQPSLLKSLPSTLRHLILHTSRHVDKGPSQLPGSLPDHPSPVGSSSSYSTVLLDLFNCFTENYAASQNLEAFYLPSEVEAVLGGRELAIWMELRQVLEVLGVKVVVGREREKRFFNRVAWGDEIEFLDVCEEAEFLSMGY